MMKKSNLIKQFALVAGIIMALFCTSCSNDNFLGIEEHNSNLRGLDYIIQSREYADYVRSFNNLSTMVYNQMDSDCCVNDTRNPVMQEYIYSYEVLVSTYPEYSSLSVKDKLYLFNYYNNYASYKVVRTKSGSPESNQHTTAWKSLNNPVPNNITKVDDDFYTCGGVVLTIYNDPNRAVSNAIVFAMGNPNDAEDNHEVGGYVFNDSSILMIDVTATVNTMSFVHWRFGSNAPQFAFHVHPIFTDLPDKLDSADSAMKSQLSIDGCSSFRIYNLNSVFRDY